MAGPPTERSAYKGLCGKRWSGEAERAIIIIIN
jgi:hypothetical protein